MSATDPLAAAVITTAPGALGQYWLLLRGLAGANLEIRGHHSGTVGAVKSSPAGVAGSFELGFRKFATVDDAAAPVLGHADLGVRLVDVLSQCPVLPSTWSLVVAWRAAAVAAGADPARADAASLPDDTAACDPTALWTERLAGPKLPPPDVAKALLAAAVAAAREHQGPVNDVWREAATALAYAAADRWLADAARRAAMARCFRASADITWAAGRADLARCCLDTAAALEDRDRRPRDAPALASSFRGLLL